MSKRNMRIAIYPGSFDPVTLGHLDIIRRASGLFDRLIVAVMHNQNKKPVFSVEERMEMLRRTTAGLPNVEIESFGGLLADYAREKGAHILLKGVRNPTDWDMELQMARINQGILPQLETLLMPASAEYEHFSSTMAREMIHYGQPLEKYLPAPIAEELERTRG